MLTPERRDALPTEQAMMRVVQNKESVKFETLAPQSSYEKIRLRKFAVKRHEQNLLVQAFISYCSHLMGY